MKQLKWIGKFLVTSLLMYIVWTKTDTHRIWQTVRRTELWPMVAAAFLYVLSRFLGAFRFSKIVSTTGIRMTNVFNLRLYWIGMFYSLLLPGGIGGDAYKIYYLKKQFPDQKTLRLTSLILWDRIAGLLVLVMIAVIPASFLFLTDSWKWSWVPVLLLVTAIAGWAIKKWQPSLKPVWGSMLTISGAIQLTQIVSFLAIMNAIGVHGKYPEYTLIFLASSIASMFPFTVGGIGLRALTFMYGCRLLLIAEEPAVAGSFLFDAIVIVSSLAGSFLLLRKPVNADEETGPASLQEKYYPELHNHKVPQKEKSTAY